MRASLIGLKEQYTELAKGRRKWVELQLPKFQVSMEQDLSPVLESIGVTDPFAEESADFVGITAQNPSADPEYTHFNAFNTTVQRVTHHTPQLNRRSLLHLSKVVHKPLLTVEEAGTFDVPPAAGASDKPLSSHPAVLRFEVDRPFVFVIYHAQLHFPVFIGQVVQPTL